MNILEIIAKKKDKKELTEEEINYFIQEYTKGNVTDYQAAALLMAIYINGMREREIKDLTLAMAYSGEVMDLSPIGDTIVDKHSTGGIGDKITMILMPIMASLGIPIAKMSGRGLGITGGTIDKLESIPGYRTDLSSEEIIQNVKDIGICLTGQTEKLAPADKKIYALRDTIACTDNIALIASSIMSKKIASGADKIVLEVTVGKGAFMKTKEKALELCNSMNQIGKLAGKETVCVITNMNDPLGKTIGNTLEVMETIEALKGRILPDVLEVVQELGAYMMKVTGRGNNILENKTKIKRIIEDGKAYEKFRELVKRQGGDLQYIDNPQKLKKAKYVVPVFAEIDGTVETIDAEVVGSVSVYLGAGRMKKEDTIDPAVGIVLNKKSGDYVEIGEALAYVHANDEKKVTGAVENIRNAYKLTSKKVSFPKVIWGVIE